MREEGDIIESATGPGHGYRLICPADPWAGHDVQKSLHTRILGQSEWIWLKDGAAINQTAVLEAMEDAPEGVVVVARRQDEGIDSTDFCWRNLPGTLTFAVILRVDWPADRLAEFTLLVQEACTAAVLDFDGPELECRKPNDLYLRCQPGFDQRRRHGQKLHGPAIVKRHTDDRFEHLQYRLCS